MKAFIPLVAAALLSLAVIVPVARAAAADAPAAQRPAPKNVPPPRPAPAGAPGTPTPTAKGPAYEFERRSTDVDRALSALLDRQAPILPTGEQAALHMAARAKAKQTLRANAKTAARAVIDELAKLKPDDVERHAELFSLLAVVVDEDAAVDYFGRKLMTGTPRPLPPLPPEPDPKQTPTKDHPKLNRSEREDPEALIRSLASAHLYRAAKAGNKRAPAALLEAAASPHLDARMKAVQYTYALERQRWKARRDLEKRLPPSDTYLLYRY